MNKERYFTRKKLDYSDSEIEEFSKSIFDQGYIIIENFFTTQTINKAKKYVEKTSNNFDLKSFSIRGDDMTDNILLDLKNSKDLKSFFIRILESSNLKNEEDENIHLVLRKCHSETNNRDSNKYHFDAYNLTLSMVIEPAIPNKRTNKLGNFYLHPNIRKFSSSLPLNIFIKLIFQNRLTRAIFKSKRMRDLFGFKEVVNTSSGSAIIFFGFRSIHGNDELSDNLSREVALFHYNDPFRNNWFIKKIEENRDKRNKDYYFEKNKLKHE
tara:strand:- start:2215 stop:3018 length:804 start_codon:yes stop_codon:yes gene_type:complete